MRSWCVVAAVPLPLPRHVAATGTVTDTFHFCALHQAAAGTRPAVPVLDLGLKPVPPYVPAALRQLSTAIMAQLRDTQDAARHYELYTALGLELDDMPGTLEEAEQALRTRHSLSRLFDQRRTLGNGDDSGVAAAVPQSLLSEESRQKAEQVARFVNRLRPAKRKVAPMLGMVCCLQLTLPL